MLGWLWRMLVGTFRSPPPLPPHQHKWKTTRVTELCANGDQAGLIGYAYTQQCDGCGDLRQVMHRWSDPPPAGSWPW